MAEYPANGAASTPNIEYGYRNGELLIEGGCDAVRWRLTDHLGSTRMSAGTSGALASVKRTDYLPFGEEIGAGVGPRTTGQGYSQTDCWRQKFTGYERDAETGLYYAHARMFSGAQGRFTSTDPIAVTKENFLNPQRWGLYVYVNNNPMADHDPNGTDGKGKGGDKVITVVMSLAIDEKGQGSNATNWKEVASKAKANGYKLEMIESEKPSQMREAIANALKKSVVVIFIAHGNRDIGAPGENFRQSSLKIGEDRYTTNGVSVASDVAGVKDIDILPKPDVSAKVVGNFSCDAKGKTDGYLNFIGTNQTVVEANGGVGGQTNTATLEAASAAFIRTYKGNVLKATAAANQVVERQMNLKDLNGEKLNSDGDRIESRVVKNR